MPNYFYNLPDDIQDLIYEWLYRIIVNEKPPPQSPTSVIVIESDSDDEI